MMEAIAFYLFSVLTIVMFLIVVYSKNALYSMSALAAGMILISGFFFLLGADFLGVVQVIVYTGAVMALYAFGMMFFDTTADIKEKIDNKFISNILIAASAILLICIVTAPFVAHGFMPDYAMSDHTLIGANNPQAIGVVLFTKYLAQFELAAVMLLVAMIAGIILVGKKMDDSITSSNAYDVKVEAEEFDLSKKDDK
ncbi:MAG TPA: NADH-quinone oxidoreductase subunit J [Campylobacterales bacterium]|nr:NADH-quinone oxidoreductase subunit J [Campylobacterales bacterium]